MADQPPRSAPPELNKAFRQNAGTPHQEPDHSVNGTARAEIQNRETHEKAHDAHEQLWRREMARLARASDPYPDFDLGSRAHRNLLGEYEERRTDWERQGAQIDNSFAVQKDLIRKTGQTVTKEFTVHKGRGPEPGGNLSKPPTPNSPNKSGQAEDFAVRDEQARKPSKEFAVKTQGQELERAR